MSTDRTTEILNYLSAMSRDMGEFRQELKQFRQEFNQFRGETNARFDRLEQRVENLEGAVGKLERSVGKLERTQQRMTRELTRVGAFVTLARGEMEDLNERVGALEGEGPERGAGETTGGSPKRDG